MRLLVKGHSKSVSLNFEEVRSHLRDQEVYGIVLETVRFS